MHPVSQGNRLVNLTKDQRYWKIYHIIPNYYSPNKFFSNNVVGNYVQNLPNISDLLLDLHSLFPWYTRCDFTVIYL